MNVTRKFKVGVIGATGMVGQRFITLLNEHPWFEISVLAASARSAGKTYAEALGGRWKLKEPLPEKVAAMTVYDAADVQTVSAMADFVFCAVDMDKQAIVALENAYAQAETPVVSNNSAHRHTPDVPMIIPEVNPEHAGIIEAQRRRLGTVRGFVAVKPNCSLQAYVPHLTPLLPYKPTRVLATTYQAISGAGKTFAEWPEMIDNVIPLIKGEEEKSEREPLKLWGNIEDGVIIDAKAPLITTQCVRVPVSDGHLAAVFVDFEKPLEASEIIGLWNSYRGRAQLLRLPSAPDQFITYFEEENRPQTALDRDIYNGMGVSAGRLRRDSMFDWKFIGLAHNTLRGAAGGAVLTAELLCADGWITKK